MQTRRAFLRTSAATAVATFAGVTGPVAARYDLVIRGGRLVDPARRLDAAMDVAVSRGRIAQIDAAHAFPDFGDLGTLRVGAPADLAVLELRNGEFEFVDNANTPRQGRSKLFAHASVVAGKVVRRRS